MRARNRPNDGAARNGVILDRVGVFSSLVNNFNASARGCGSPAIPTLFGPLRIWKYANTLRSRRVKKAIARRAITNVIKRLIEVISSIIKGNIKSIYRA